MSDASALARPRSPQQIAIGMIQDAEAYRVAATRTHPRQAPLTDGHLATPAWHLLCHAAELTLKAYLLSDGADPSAKLGGVMHTSVRHNLLRLYEMAVARGLRPPDEDFGDLMDWLSPYHGAHVFRYRQVGRARLPAPFFVAGILEPVIAEVAQTVRERWLATQRPDDDAVIAGVGLARAQPPEDLP